MARTNATTVVTGAPDEPVIDLVAARARLEAQRDRLLARLAPADDDTIGELTATYGTGETEHIVLGVEREIAAALDANTRETLADIASALARIDDGSYGLCRTCRLPIAPERLEAIPETRWCVVCQPRSEDRRR
jgi:DnaK suppressor protein